MSDMKYYTVTVMFVVSVIIAYAAFAELIERIG